MNVLSSPHTQEHIDTVVAQALARQGTQAGALLPLLHAIQDALNYIPPNSVDTIAKHLNLSRAEVHGVISFYHHFRSSPPGGTVLQICSAEACQACGAHELMALAQNTLNCAPHHTNSTGTVTLEPVYCLGLCATAPAVQLGDQLHGRVTANRLTALLKPYQAD